MLGNRALCCTVRFYVLRLQVLGSASTMTLLCYLLLLMSAGAITLCFIVEVFFVVLAPSISNASPRGGISMVTGSQMATIKLTMVVGHLPLIY